MAHIEFTETAISPSREMAAYEALWLQDGATFKRIADKFRKAPGALPSQLVTETKISEAALAIDELLSTTGVGRFGVRINGAGEYPDRLRDALNPVEVLYYQGWWDLINTRCIAVVGARKVTDEGKRRTRKLVKSLVADGFTIVSGLAEGVDTVAHQTAIEHNGYTIGVIGTPLSQAYPRDNTALQRLIREKYLLVSQVPFKKYHEQDYRLNKSFFPERNITMSALTEATIIVEASDTSGTLYQARAALNQGRKLFILESCFQNPSIEWPDRFAKKGAIRVRDYEDIIRNL